MKYKSIIKIIISIAMLTFVLSIVDIDSLARTLFQIPLWVALIVVIGYFLGQALSAVKWMLLAKSGGIDSQLPSALKAYFIGMYVNCFGLGIVGGDVTRGVLLAEGKPVKTEAIVSVVADRVHGLCVLSLLGTLSTLLFGFQTLDPSFLYLLLLIGFGIIAGWLVGPKILLLIVQPDNKLREKAEQIIRFFPKNISTLAIITIISLLFHLLQISLHGIIAYGLGASLPWQYLLIVIPFVNIVSSLPISWNGLGVRETAYVFFFCGSHGYMSEEQVVAMGALWLLAVTVTSAIGGVVAFLTKDFRLAAEATSAQTEPNS